MERGSRSPLIHRVSLKFGLICLLLGALCLPGGGAEAQSVGYQFKNSIDRPFYSCEAGNLLTRLLLRPHAECPDEYIYCDGDNTQSYIYKFLINLTPYKRYLTNQALLDKKTWFDSLRGRQELAFDFLLNQCAASYLILDNKKNFYKIDYSGTRRAADPAKALAEAEESQGYCNAFIKVYATYKKATKSTSNFSIGSSFRSKSQMRLALKKLEKYGRLLYSVNVKLSKVVRNRLNSLKGDVTGDYVSCNHAFKCLGRPYYIGFASAFTYNLFFQELDKSLKDTCPYPPPPSRANPPYPGDPVVSIPPPIENPQDPNVGPLPPVGPITNPGDPNPIS